MDNEDEDDWEPTPEEQAAIDQQILVAKRFPTFVLLAKALMRHTRYSRLRSLEAPEQILSKSAEMRDEAMDELCAAFPFQDGVRIYHLEDVLYTLREELIRPHDSSKTDS